MARQEINTGIAPTGLGGDTPRSASIKINMMTQEIYDNLPTASAPLPVAKGGTGAKTVAEVRTTLGVVPVTSNTDTTVGKLLSTGYGGVGRPLVEFSGTPDAAIARNMGASFSYLSAPDKAPGMVADGALATFGANPDYAVQLAMDWRTGNMYSRYKAGAEPSIWGQFVRAGDFGVGADRAQAVLDLNAIPLSGQFRFAPGAANAGAADGYGIVTRGAYEISTGTWADHIITINTQRSFLRTSINGAVNAIQEYFTTANAGLDPAVGGLLSSIMVGGWRISKFRNGVLQMSTWQTVNAGPFAANQIATHRIQLPVAAYDWGHAGVSVSVTGVTSADHYGAINSIMNTADTVDITIRNGAIAQSFNLRVFVTAYWGAP